MGSCGFLDFPVMLTFLWFIAFCIRSTTTSWYSSLVNRTNPKKTYYTAELNNLEGTLKHLFFQLNRKPYFYLTNLFQLIWNLLMPTFHRAVSLSAAKERKPQASQFRERDGFALEAGAILWRANTAGGHVAACREDSCVTCQTTVLVTAFRLEDIIIRLRQSLRTWSKYFGTFYLN